MHRMLGGALAVLLVGLAAAASLAAQSIETGDLTLELTGRVQTQFNTTSVDENELGEPIAWSTLETRRVRFGVDLAYRDWLTAKIEPDFALGEIELKDAWINWAFDPAVEIRFGQFKKPFSRIELISATQILPIERGLRIRGLGEFLGSRLDVDGDPILVDFDGDLVLGEYYELLDVMGYLGRDLGVSVHGELGDRLAYAAGVFSGSGADEGDVDDRKSFAGRLVYTPSTSLPLSLGGGISYRETRLETLAADDEEVGGAAFELDAEWGSFRRPGLHVLVEGALGENLVTDGSFLAAQGWLGYFRPVAGRRVEGIEPLVRVSWADADIERDDDHGILLTPGVNLYFSGHNRLMLNWDLYFSGIEDVDAENALRVQAQVNF